MKSAENGYGPQIQQRASLSQGLRQRYILIGISFLLVCSACFLYYLLQQEEANAKTTMLKSKPVAAVKTQAIDITSDITVEDNVPVLRWEGEFPQGTIFLLERATNGSEWEMIQRVPKEEVMVSNGEFRFSDAEAEGAEVKYRLTCVNAGNEVIASDELQVTLTGRKEQMITITGIEPLPFVNQLTVSFEADVEEPISFEIIDNNSNAVYSEVYTVKKGENLIGFTRGEKLPPGVYIIRLSGSDSAIAMTKVVKN